MFDFLFSCRFSYIIARLQILILPKDSTYLNASPMMNSEQPKIDSPNSCYEPFTYAWDREFLGSFWLAGPIRKLKSRTRKESYLSMKKWIIFMLSALVTVTKSHKSDVYSISRPVSFRIIKFSFFCSPPLYFAILLSPFSILSWARVFQSSLCTLLRPR